MKLVFAFLLGAGIAGAVTSVIWIKKCRNYEIAIEAHNEKIMLNSIQDHLIRLYPYEENKTLRRGND